MSYDRLDDRQVVEALSERSQLELEAVELEAEARHARERYRLYRAKAYGPRLTSAARLRELERESKFAERRLDRAKAEPDPLAPRR